DHYCATWDNSLNSGLF
nr:immunoglobulin light chain junction region [Macaca mulatta]